MPSTPASNLRTTNSNSNADEAIDRIRIGWTNGNGASSSSVYPMAMVHIKVIGIITIGVSSFPSDTLSLSLALFHSLYRIVNGSHFR